MGAAQKKLLAQTHLQKCRERDAVTQLLREHMLRDAIGKTEMNDLHHIVKYIDVDSCLSSGDSLLTYAAGKGSLEAVDLLLQVEADVNAPDKNGVTALRAAVLAGASQVADLLIQFDADLNTWDDSGLNVLHQACVQGNSDVVGVLLARGLNAKAVTKNKDKTCGIILSATAGHEACITQLVKHKADVNQKDVWGYTALCKAASNRHSDCVSTLLDSGANPDLSNRSGATPIQYAVIRDHCDIVHLLLQRGASTSKYSSDLPPLAAAALNGCNVCAMELFNHGAKLEAADKHRRTPLYYSLADLSLIEHLYQYYPLKKTPDRLYCAKLLINEGADVERVWKARFWNTRFKSAEQVALYKLAICACGFKNIPQNTLDHLFQKVIASGCAVTAKVMWASGYCPKENVFFPSDGEESLVQSACKTCELDNDSQAQMCVSKEYKERTCELLNKSRNNPRTLRNICAIHIRKALSRNVIHLSSTMGLASDHKNYLLLNAF